MTRFPLGAGVAASMLMLAACYTPPPPPQESRSDAAQTAACRSRMDAVYEQQNRGELYTDRSDMARDAMLSGSYVEGVTSRGLAARFERERAFSECLREGTSPGRTVTGGASSPSGANTQ